MAVLLSVWLFCLGMVANALAAVVLSLVAILSFGMNAALALWVIVGLLCIQLSAKIIADVRLLSSTARFFNRRDLLRARTFLPSLLLHIYYIAFVGTLANVVREYEWKGRRVR